MPITFVLVSSSNQNNSWNSLSLQVFFTFPYLSFSHSLALCNLTDTHKTISTDRVHQSPVLFTFSHLLIIEVVFERERIFAHLLINAQKVNEWTDGRCYHYRMIPLQSNAIKLQQASISELNLNRSKTLLKASLRRKRDVSFIYLRH